MWMPSIQIRLRLFLLLSVLLTVAAVISAQSDDHGLAYETSDGAASPAMRSFFHDDGSSSGNATELLPVAAGRSEGADPLVVEVGDADGGGRGKVRTALIAVGIVFGVAGVGILGVAVAMYLVQKKKREGEEERLRGERRVLHHLEPV